MKLQPYPEQMPREKLLTRGVQTLSDLELLSVMIGSGSAKIRLKDLASSVLGFLDQNPEINAERLIELPGMGTARACLLIAAIEFARRRIRPRGHKISTPEDVYRLLCSYSDRSQEYFFAICLNGAHEVIEYRTVSVGLLNRTQVHPREVYCNAIEKRAAAIIVAHNHPSGSLKPSEDDIQVTERLKKSGDILGIGLLDHIIFTSEGFISLQELGIL